MRKTTLAGLIKRLQKLEKKYGHLPVYAWDAEALWAGKGIHQADKLYTVVMLDDDGKGKHIVFSDLASMDGFE